jgi:hypothetical protein
LLAPKPAVHGILSWAPASSPFDWTTFAVMESLTPCRPPAPPNLLRGRGLPGRLVRRMIAVMMVSSLMGIGWAAETWQIYLPTRLPFVSQTLDETRKILEHKLGGRRVALTVHSLFSAPGSDREAEDGRGGPSLLLVETGAEIGVVPAGAHLTPITMDFLWLFGIHEDLMCEVGVALPTTTTEWASAMSALRARDPFKYPWFSSLYSHHTLLRLQDVLEGPADSPAQGATGTASGNDPVAARFEPPDFWRRASPLEIIQQCFDSGFLNPLTIESDEALAFEVFEARDAVFTTVWLPREALASDSSLRKSLGNPVFLPFPARDPEHPTAVPVVRYRLWCVDEVLVAREPRLSATIPGNNDPGEGRGIPQFPLERLCSYAADLAWITGEYPSLYDRLVTGEP